MCCPGCCRSSDLGTHEWCLDCEDNPCCRSVHRNERDPIYDRPAPNDQRRGTYSTSAAEEMLQVCMEKYRIPEKDKIDQAAAASKHTRHATWDGTANSDASVSAVTSGVSKSTTATAAAKDGEPASQKQKSPESKDKADDGAQDKQKCVAM